VRQTPQLNFIVSINLKPLEKNYHNISGGVINKIAETAALSKHF